jgi:hypothetical protein
LQPTLRLVHFVPGLARLTRRDISQACGVRWSSAYG